MCPMCDPAHPEDFDNRDGKKTGAVLGVCRADSTLCVAMQYRGVMEEYDAAPIRFCPWCGDRLGEQR